jgi:NADP-dependent alcohol dehydrogenase
LVAGAIQKTGEFYESLGLSIKASEYGVNQETIAKIVKRFEARGVNFGEKADITPAVVAEILEMSIA